MLTHCQHPIQYRHRLTYHNKRTAAATLVDRSVAGYITYNLFCQPCYYSVCVPRRVPLMRQDGHALNNDVDMVT